MWIFRSAADGEAVSGRLGLPPGATNYITARGAKRLRDELQNLPPPRQRACHRTRNKFCHRSILSILRDAPSNSVTFGATVTGDK